MQFAYDCRKKVYKHLFASYTMAGLVVRWPFIALNMLSFLKNGTGKILNLFFQDPDKEYYFREIAKILGKEPGFFQKSLENLVNEGILLD